MTKVNRLLGMRANMKRMLDEIEQEISIEPPDELPTDKVRKTFVFHINTVSCNNCQFNYSVNYQRPGTMCTALSSVIDLSRQDFNRKTAAECERWVPIRLDKLQVFPEE